MIRNAYLVHSTGHVTIFTRHKGAVWVFLVDVADLSLLEGVTWHVHKGRVTHYVDAQVSTETGQTTVQLHRLLLAPDNLLDVDHINHDGLDNRRVNLRAVSPSVNRINQRSARRESKSGHQGVEFSYGKWNVRIRQRGKAVFYRRYETLKEAVFAAEQARAILIG